MRISAIQNENFLLAKRDLKKEEKHSSSILATDYKPMPKSFFMAQPSFKGNLRPSEAFMQMITRNKQDQELNDYIWATSWDLNKASAEYDKRYEKEIEIRRKQTRWFNPGLLSEKTKTKIKEKYDNLLKADKEKYDRIMEYSPYYKEQLAAKIKKMPVDFTEVMANYKGSLNTKIAGYNALKTSLSAEFIQPIRKEAIQGGEEKVANSILLCGPTGCGKTVAAEAIANETHCKTVRIKTDIETNKFADIVRYELIPEARKRYEKVLAKNQAIKDSEEFKNMTHQKQTETLLNMESPRTVILVDEIDRYFNPLVTDKNDIKNNNMVLKTILDGCSKLPNESGEGCATTFLFTSNYPSIMLGPNSKTDIGPTKCTPHAILPPSDEDMEAVIKFYLKKGNQYLSDQLEKKPNLNFLYKLVDIDNLNLTKFVEKYGPQKELGAYSNDAIAHIVPSAFELYMEQPEKGFNLSFLRAFKYAGRDITPAKLDIYMNELAELGLAEKPKKVVDISNLPKKQKYYEMIKSLQEAKATRPELWTEHAQARLEKFINEYKKLEGDNN